MPAIVNETSRIDPERPHVRGTEQSAHRGTEKTKTFSVPQWLCGRILRVSQPVQRLLQRAAMEQP
jgi:hypothetical protein